MIRKGCDTAFICGIPGVTPEFVEKIRRDMEGLKVEKKCNYDKSVVRHVVTVVIDYFRNGV